MEGPPVAMVATAAEEWQWRRRRSGGRQGGQARWGLGLCSVEESLRRGHNCRTARQARNRAARKQSGGDGRPARRQRPGHPLDTAGHVWARCDAAATHLAPRGARRKEGSAGGSGFALEVRWCVSWRQRQDAGRIRWRRRQAAQRRRSAAAPNAALVGRRCGAPVADISPALLCKDAFQVEYVAQKPILPIPQPTLQALDTEPEHAHLGFTTGCSSAVQAPTALCTNLRANKGHLAPNGGSTAACCTPSPPCSACRSTCSAAA